MALEERRANQNVYQTSGEEVMATVTGKLIAFTNLNVIKITGGLFGFRTVHLRDEKGTIHKMREGDVLKLKIDIDVVE
jgi:allophanate hydrolase subunit 2